MIVEVVAVGTELLIGQIINSNVATIGRRLADGGFDAHFQTTVGDNLGRLTQAIADAAVRADAVVLTGGIGPTQDDMTREALCAYAGREMSRDAEHEAAIRERLLRTRGSVNSNVFRMADYPAGAEPLPNAKGVALGVAMEHDGTWFFAIPGVPREMETMLDEEVMPRLRALSGEPSILKSRVLRTWGFGESQISEILDDLYESTNPSVAFLINASEVRIRISAKAESEAMADRMIRKVEAIVEERLGDAIFGRDDETVEVLLVRMLADLNWTVGTVETATFGLVGSQLAASAGAIAVYAGSVTLPAAPVGPDVEARAAELLASGPAADVVLAVSEVHGELDGSNSTRQVGVAVRTRERTGTRTVRLLGDDERARRFGIVGALHAARLAIAGVWWDGA
ncbi:MAG: molybdopterin-binding protein [Acidimicrobiia bacterium]|nr:molybdopterin-binding protein [Acidimicrobiia bacterium]